jgi:hypothetical protein
MDEHLTTTSPAWPAMWEALADATGDYADCNPDNGESWQYMGTYDGVHQFRHRHRPETARPITGFAGRHVDRVYLHIDAATLRVIRVHVNRYLDAPAESHSGHVVRPASTPQTIPDTRDCSGSDYGGAFDGINVISDADPGL